MPALTLGNVLVYSTQFAVVVLVGLAAARVAGIRRTRFHYAYLRGLLLIGLLLPFVQPLTPSALLPRFALTARALPGNGAQRIAFAEATPHRPSTVDPRAAAGMVLIAGTAVRLAWLAAGLVALRALRRQSTQADPLMPAYVHALSLVQATADVRLSSRVSRPVTFGLVRPVILLPTGFHDLGEDEQVGVVAHELLHVKRRDWAHVLLEEIVRVGLWFHPVAWWLLKRISVAREQLVDGMVVALTRGRRAYLDALLKVARFQGTGPRVPAPAMLRESQLGERVRLLLEEVIMSPKRVQASLVVSCSLVVVSGALAVQALPLAPRAQVPSAGPTPSTTPGTMQPVLPAVQEAAHAPQLVKRVPPTTAAVSPEPFAIVQVDIGTDGRVRDAAAVSGDPAAIDLAVEAVRQWQFEPPNEPQQTMIGLNLGAGAWEGANASGPGLRVGGAVKPPSKTRHSPPEYPADAKEAGVQGIVILEAVIAPNGQVREARVLKSVAALDAAALDSVLRWEFTPTLLNGAPVPVIMTVTVNFTLQ